MAKIIYICGLGHSGSTILDMALGAHPRVAGMGEVFTLLDDRHRERHYQSTCSCGKKAPECPFWGPVKGALEQEEPLENRYERLLEHAARYFGEGTIFVDSSKNSYSYLSYLNRHHDLTILCLSRDFRSWSYSRHLSTGKPLVYFFFRWWLENLKLRMQLKKMKLKPIETGYEELVLYPGEVLRMLAEQTGIPYDPLLLNPGKTHSHIISGNISRVDPQKRSSFRYDARWFLSTRLIILSWLFAWLNRLNRKWVYSHLNRHGISGFPVFGSRRRKELSNRHN